MKYPVIFVALAIAITATMDATGYADFSGFNSIFFYFTKVNIVNS